MMTHSPKDIYQDWLDRIANAVWSGDHDLVAANMVYPSPMATRDSVVEYTSERQLAEASAEFRDYLQRIGADGYHRICQTADMSADSAEIHGTHMTYILRAGTYVVDPFANKMTLRYVDGAWRGAGLSSDVDNRHCTILSPQQVMAQAALKCRRAQS